MSAMPLTAYAKSQRATCASRIAEICEKHFPKYGIWPSVAIGQAFVESGLYSGGRNLFGVRGCSGLSIEEATERYLQCLQNQYFRGEANFAKTPEEQLAIIMKGGRYCAGQYPGGSYYRNVINSIDNHNWRSFDEHIKRKIKKKEAAKRRRKRHQKPFRIIFDDSLPEGTAVSDPEYIKKGSTIVFSGGIVEATYTRRGLGNVLRLNNIRRCTLPTCSPLRISIYEFFDGKRCRGFNVNLTEVIENVKG